MTTKAYHVIADFTDAVAGGEVKAGTLFEADDDRLAILKTAGVVGEVATKEDIEAAKKAGEGNADKS